MAEKVINNGKGKSGDKYYRILEAAGKMFAVQGFFQTTISQIAKEAGVADGTIYLYFKNKNDILHQFFNYKSERVFRQFRSEVDKSRPAANKLRKLIQTHLEVFQRDRDMATLFQTETRRNSLVEKQIKDVSKMYLEILGDILSQCQEEGSVRKDLDVDLVKRFFLGAVNEVINSWVFSSGKYDLASRAEPLADLILRGIGDN